MRIGLLAGAALAVAAVIAYLGSRPVEPDPPFVVEPTEIDAGTVTIGAHKLTVTVHNPAGRPRRVIGFERACGRNCCFGSTDHRQLLVPAGGTAVCSCEYVVYQPKPFHAPATLYLEENGVRAVEVTVRGVGVAAPGQNDDPDQP
jgi:hypothetical protein